MKLKYSDFREMQDKINTSGYAANYVLGCYEVLIAQIGAELSQAKQKDLMASLENLKKRVDQNYNSAV
jgi:hypothetical protein